MGPPVRGVGRGRAGVVGCGHRRSAIGVSCQHCDVPLELPNIDLATGTAWCAACENVTDLAAIQRKQGIATLPRAGERPLPPQPGHFDVQNDPHHLVVSWRWFSWKIVFLTFFAVFWDGFLVVWYTMAIGGLAATGGAEMVPMLVFPLLHVGVGVGLTVYVLAGWLNRTWVAVADGRLTVTWGPIWWPGQQDWAAADIRQLYTQRHVRRSKNGTTTTYAVHVIDPGGRQHTLISGLSTPGEATWLERRIEQHLGIADEEVAGEVAR